MEGRPKSKKETILKASPAVATALVGAMHAPVQASPETYSQHVDTQEVIIEDVAYKTLHERGVFTFLEGSAAIEKLEKATGIEEIPENIFKEAVKKLEEAAMEKAQKGEVKTEQGLIEDAVALEDLKSSMWNVKNGISSKEDAFVALRALTKGISISQENNDSFGGGKSEFKVHFDPDKASITYNLKDFKWPWEKNKN